MSDDYCTIYKLTNLINDKIYIGQTWLSLEQRMGPDGCNYNNSPKLYNAIKKYGSENFKYTVLYKAQDQEEADAVESYFITTLKSQHKDIGYNLKAGGRGGKHSKESIEKIKKALVGRIVSKETRIKISKIHKGLPKPKTKEHREQVSETMKNWHKNNDHPLLGTHRTEEQKKAQSKKLKGRPHKKEVVEARNEKLREKFAMTENEELEIIRLYQEEELSYRAITEILGINNRKIYRVFEKYNIKPRKKNEKANQSRWKKHNNFLKSVESEIINMYQNNIYNIYDIKEKYKTSQDKIYEILERNNIPIKECKKDYKNIYDMYHDKRFTLKDICNKYNICITTIYRIVNKNNDSK